MKLRVNKISSASSNINGYNNNQPNLEKSMRLSIPNEQNLQQTSTNNEIMELTDPTMNHNDNEIVELRDPQMNNNQQNMGNEDEFEKMMKQELQQNKEPNRKISTNQTPNRRSGLFGNSQSRTENKQKNESNLTKKKKNYGNYLVIGSVIVFLSSYLMN